MRRLFPKTAEDMGRVGADADQYLEAFFQRFFVSLLPLEVKPLMLVMPPPLDQRLKSSCFVGFLGYALRRLCGSLVRCSDP